MNADVLKRYNVPVPRYTSYPPANYFVPFTGKQYAEAVEQSNTSANNHLSFYLHIPFCRHLCHYCGCNSYPMARPEAIETYVKALHREIDLLLPLLDKSRRISQIHYGGGSPTAIPIRHIKELNEHLLSAFGTIEAPEVAIECHPGYLTEQDWTELSECGFNRYSIGVQDFDPQVLKTVNRRPSLLPVEKILAFLRSTGASVNMDFLYGLPGQTVDTFTQTISHAVGLLPDRLVLFSYAHVPWVNKRQLILEKAGLPSGEEKNGLFNKAAEILKEAGYRAIGMDHFVLPNDELNNALQNKQLHRNFQGYCTRRTTAQVYALGVTGISQLDTAYAQNTKDIAQYAETIGKGEFTTAKGYLLNREEQITREVIESLMCNYHIHWTSLSEHLKTPVEDIKQATAYDNDTLQRLANDGLIECTNEKLSVTTSGLPFIRNIAASLDKLMLNPTHSFSKPF